MEVHVIKGFIQSLYLIEYEDKLLLLDSGTIVDVQVVKNFIENELKRPFLDLKLVVVTHAHPDHSGGAMEYKRLGVMVVGSALSNDWYKGLRGLVTYFIDILLTYLVFFKTHKKKRFQNIFFSRFVDYDFTLSDEDPLPGFPDWKVVSAPGHTASDLSLYHQGTQRIYVADNLIFTRRGIISPYPVNFPKQYKESLRKYLELDIETFLLAHYGERVISKGELTSFIDDSNFKRVTHTNSLFKILTSLLRFYR